MKTTKGAEPLFGRSLSIVATAVVVVVVIIVVVIVVMIVTVMTGAVVVTIIVVVMLIVLLMLLMVMSSLLLASNPVSYCAITSRQDEVGIPRSHCQGPARSEFPRQSGVL